MFINKNRRWLLSLSIIASVVSATFTFVLIARAAPNQATASSQFHQNEPTPLSNIVQVSMGVWHACALSADGEVLCWGGNQKGQLGNGTIMPTLTPVKVLGLPDDIISVGTGDGHTCVLTGSGGVKCWGDNYTGQLGNGTTSGSLTPVDVGGFSNNVVSLSVGAVHSCAVTNRGIAKCWGSNWAGELGDGTTISQSTPVTVTNLSEGVQSISAGEIYTCAVTNGGGVKCWGNNGHGQLGIGATDNVSTPVGVINLDAGVESVKANLVHTCALLVNGKMKCWGNGDHGALGNEGAGSKTPVDVKNLVSDVQAISLGNKFTCAVTTGEGLQCWGFNELGQLGNGTTTNSSVPIAVTGLSDGVTSISSNISHTCAIVNGVVNGQVKCWGKNIFDDQSTGNFLNSLVPVDVVMEEQPVEPPTTPLDTVPLSNVKQVSMGVWHACALTNDGEVLCWGGNQWGQLGNGTRMPSLIPVKVLGLPDEIISVGTGEDHTCVLTSSGDVKCWGSNYMGQLGNGTTTGNFRPVDVIGFSHDVISLSVGGAHSCALTNHGVAKCWGGNSYGELGDGTTISQNTPVTVTNLNEGIDSLTVGSNHTCAVSNGGSVKCWGHNGHGQLGIGIAVDSISTPTDVINLDSGVEVVVADLVHTCALLANGGMKCWGNGGHGALGNAGGGSTTPVDVANLTSDVQAISLGHKFTCALTQNEGLQCWGYNQSGQLGNDTVESSPLPVAVANLSDGVTDISSNLSHSCAVVNGGVKCWGYNIFDEQSIGDFLDSPVPVDVMVEAQPAPNNFNCIDVSEIPQSECNALVSFYESTGGAAWTNKDGWLQTSTPCSWFGVHCTNESVNQLSLTQNNLMGPIPSSIADLPNLDHIYLNDNQFSGPLPAELGLLNQLTYLRLDNNAITGTIPIELGNLTNLELLQLPGNQLSGPIPESLGNLSQLKILRLEDNQLDGSIPAQLGQLSKLQTLDLWKNKLTGNIPPELTALTHLETLRLYDNQLIGILPQEINQLQALQMLIVRNNSLDGTVPATIADLLQLTYLDIGHNSFEGPLPTEIGNLTKLTYFSAQNNRLSGVIPSSVGALTQLEKLALDQNSFSGAIPPEIGNLSLMHTLYLQKNQLTGSVPSELSGLVSAKELHFHVNGLSGPFPLALSSLTNLDILDFRFTKICEPTDSAFETWLSTITTVSGTALPCPDEPATTPPPTVTLTPTDIPTPTPILPTLTPPATPTTVTPIEALSVECRDITPPGEPRAEICVTGFVYVNGLPADDVPITIRDQNDVVIATTKTQIHHFPHGENRAHYRAVLQTVSLADTFTVKAESNGQSEIVPDIIAQSGVQQVDLVFPDDDSRPIATIKHVNKLMFQDSDILEANGVGQVGKSNIDIAAWRWESDRDGLLVESATLSKPVEQLSNGLHQLSFSVQDNEGTWSAPVTTEIDVLNENQVEWTVLLYLAGDYPDGGTLKRKFTKALKRIRKKLDTPSVRIAAYVDGPADGDTVSYLIEPSQDSGKAHIIGPVSIGEKAMDSADTLTEFINWGKNEYAAEHTYLVIADHGQVLRGIAWDKTSDLADDGEENFSQYLTVKEIATGIQNSTIQQVDILHFDACTMNLFEAAYELRDQADLLITSQYYGWDYFAYELYADLFNSLDTPQLIANRVIREYANLANRGNRPFTISALDMTKMDQAVESLNELGASLTQALESGNIQPSDLETVRNAVQTFDSDGNFKNDSDDVYVDLVDWSTQISQRIPNEEIRSLATTLVSTLSGDDSFILDSKASGDVILPSQGPDGTSVNVNLLNANGLSIFYPTTPSRRYAEYISGDLFTFTEDESQWRDFLEEIPGTTPGGTEVTHPLPGPHQLMSQEQMVFLPVSFR